MSIEIGAAPQHFPLAQQVFRGDHIDYAAENHKEGSPMDDQGGVLDRIRSAGRNKLHGDELSAFLRDVDELAGCQDREAAIVVVDRLSKSLGLQTPCPQSCYDA